MLGVEHIRAMTTDFELSIQIKLFVIISLYIAILYLLATKETGNGDCELLANSKPQYIKAADTGIRLSFDRQKYDMFKSSLDYDNDIPSSKKNDKLPVYLRKNIEKIVEVGGHVKEKAETGCESINKKINEFDNLVKICTKLLFNTYISNPHIISLKI